jgi:hypothetical protein
MPLRIGVRPRLGDVAELVRISAKIVELFRVPLAGGQTEESLRAGQRIVPSSEQRASRRLYRTTGLFFAAIISGRSAA